MFIFIPVAETTEQIAIRRKIRILEEEHNKKRDELWAQYKSFQKPSYIAIEKKDMLST